MKLEHRSAGVLLHISSLPGPCVQGEMGAEAFHFIDFLSSAGMSVWQTLPLVPTHSDRSPYNGLSVHAGNPELISLSVLHDWGWLSTIDVGDRQQAMDEAHTHFQQSGSDEARADYAKFIADQSHWLDDYALFMVLRDVFNTPWVEWPAAERDRDPVVMQSRRDELATEVESVRFTQFVFDRQWSILKRYANQHSVKMFGDVPIFVAYDSADVWANRACFRLDEEGHVSVVTGVPPDYFSQTGQRWGNPHYDWSYLQRHGFDWWVDRLRSQLSRFDLLRVDHFRGFESSWEIDANEQTAEQGVWAKVPGLELFTTLEDRLGPLPLVAEDLGIISVEVEQLRDDLGLPGMKVLQFAFSGDADNPHLPYNHSQQAVVYTGTHDNDTSIGWFDGLDHETRAVVSDSLDGDPQAMPWPLIREALASTAGLAMFPMQDLLELGSDGRMNTPGIEGGNWEWRFQWDEMADDLAARMRVLLGRYGRLVM